MTADFAIELFKAMIYQALSLGAPVLLTAAILGLVVCLFQAAATIQKQTQTVVPKALTALSVLLLLLPWTVRSLSEIAVTVIETMPRIVR